MAFQRAPLNPREPLIELVKSQMGQPSRSFLTYMRDVRADLDASPASFEPVSLTGQNASIGTTAIPTDGDLSAGLYRVTVYQRVTTIAVTSSSLTTAISWTDGAVACAFSGTALTGNTTATVGSFSFLLRTDAASPISYATTYASNGAGEMRYRLSIVLERIALE